ncbi:hypothetical protein R3W88_005046 [Solanum pinnatisectum]|uniref:Uncharacterized protein n=1 Tax=Solanum pinnatisectum TaxID=50273 RepID=A0AAV9KCB3_9SOLN|nr:hypothetical protein R3W88_005046 [Solanum pinnatisectum]
MSEEAPRYLKTLPEVGKLTNISRNGNPSEKQVENIDENHEEKERENPILLVEPIPNEDCKVNSGMELGTSEVEYIESENLKDVEDVDMSLKGADGIKTYGIEKLIQLAASQLSDKLPESREAARALLLDLQNVYEKTLDMTPTDVSENPQANSWEHFCQSKLFLV